MMTDLMIVAVVAVAGLVGLLVLAAVKLRRRTGEDTDIAQMKDSTRGNGSIPGTGGGVFGGL